MSMYSGIEFSTLVGQTIKKFSGDKRDELVFEMENGKVYRMVYYQDCCASATIEEIHGDLDDLIGTPILLAEEVQSVNKNPPGVKVPKYQDCFTWTFYKLSTIKGSVTIRWYGESNGYYSEEATFEEVK